MKTIINIQNATTSELVSFFNANCSVIEANPVKRFADRKTAEARCAKVLAAMPVEAPKARRSAAEGIAESWKNPEVAAKRLTKHNVIAQGNGYKSVREAFEALNLPESKHIKFRMQLKAEGKADFSWAGKTYSFAIA